MQACAQAGDPVMTLAMSASRELIRMAIKQKGLHQVDWPASWISQAAKALLESQGEDGVIVQAARKHVEAEREAAKEVYDRGRRRRGPGGAVASGRPGPCATGPVEGSAAPRDGRWCVFSEGA
jgi:hypothetical protein